VGSGSVGRNGKAGNRKGFAATGAAIRLDCRAAARQFRSA